MTSAISRSGERLDLGRVIGTSFGVLGRRWPAIGVFVGVSWLPTAIFSIAQPRFIRPGSHDASGFLIQAGLLIALLFLTGLQHAAVTAVATTPTAQRSTLGAAIVSAIRAAPALAPYWILVTLPTTGFNLWQAWSLVDGGPLANPSRVLPLSLLSTGAALVAIVVAVAAWGVLTPVVVVERRGLLPALGRSWRLLAGSRWRLVVLWGIMTLIGGAPGVMASLAAFPMSSQLSVDAFALALHIIGAATGLVSASANGMWQVMSAMSYLELSRIRDGVAAADVEDIFA